jgi:hypothetical protein
MPWIAGELSGLGLGRAKGQDVTTETCVGPVPVTPGDPFVASYGAFGPYARARLLARIQAVFALQCRQCSGPMRITAFIIDLAPVCNILVHFDQPRARPRMAPARAPPLWAVPQCDFCHFRVERSAPFATRWRTGLRTSPGAPEIEFD